MEKVKISKDGTSINFVTQEQLPASPKKFRQSPELEGFYRFLHENDLRKEALEVIDVYTWLAKPSNKQKN